VATSACPCRKVLRVFTRIGPSYHARVKNSLRHSVTAEIRGEFLIARLLRAEMRAAAEHADAEEEAEIVPAAGVRHRVDRDVGIEQRADPGEREHEPVPQPPPEARRAGGLRDS